jgi:hypothetical protein
VDLVALTDRHDAGDQPASVEGVHLAQNFPLGKAEAQEGPAMTVLVYANTSKQVGDAGHLKVFANADAAETWLKENDPEGVAFEYEVQE